MVVVPCEGISRRLAIGKWVGGRVKGFHVVTYAVVVHCDGRRGYGFDGEWVDVVDSQERGLGTCGPATDSFILSIGYHSPTSQGRKAR